MVYVVVFYLSCYYEYYLIIPIKYFMFLLFPSLVYRDLKPENVGFNIRDDIVLFDFGLAREVQEKEKVTDTTWKLTGETGSLRYMSPEVVQNKPYGKIYVLFKTLSLLGYLDCVVLILIKQSLSSAMQKVSLPTCTPLPSCYGKCSVCKNPSHYTLSQCTLN